MITAIHSVIARKSLIRHLEEVRKDCGEVSTFYFPPGMPQTGIDKALEKVLEQSEIPDNVSKTIAGSSTGAMLIWGESCKYLVLPPFPISEQHLSPTCNTEALCTLLRHEFYIALVLIRLGSYAIGVFKGDQLITSKAGTGLVHARHRQGGSSSHRFERHREKQIEAFFTRVCGHLREQLEPYSRQMDYVLYGGTRETVTEFREQCHYSRAYDNLTLNRLLNLREPRQSTLEQAVREAYISQVIEWRQG